MINSVLYSVFCVICILHIYADQSVLTILCQRLATEAPNTKLDNIVLKYVRQTFRFQNKDYNSSSLALILK